MDESDCVQISTETLNIIQICSLHKKVYFTQMCYISLLWLGCFGHGWYVLIHRYFSMVILIIMSIYNKWGYVQSSTPDSVCCILCGLMCLECGCWAYTSNMPLLDNVSEAFWIPSPCNLLLSKYRETFPLWARSHVSEIQVRLIDSTSFFTHRRDVRTF